MLDICDSSFDENKAPDLKGTSVFNISTYSLKYIPEPYNGYQVLPLNPFGYKNELNVFYRVSHRKEKLERDRPVVVYPHPVVNDHGPFIYSFGFLFLAKKKDKDSTN